MSRQLTHRHRPYSIILHMSRSHAVVFFFFFFFFVTCDPHAYSLESRARRTRKFTKAKTFTVNGCGNVVRGGMFKSLLGFRFCVVHRPTTCQHNLENPISDKLTWDIADVLCWIWTKNSLLLFFLFKVRKSTSLLHLPCGRQIYIYIFYFGSQDEKTHTRSNVESHVGQPVQFTVLLHVCSVLCWTLGDLEQNHGFFFRSSTWALLQGRRTIDKWRKFWKATFWFFGLHFSFSHPFIPKVVVEKTCTFQLYLPKTNSQPCTLFFHKSKGPCTCYDVSTSNVLQGKCKFSLFSVLMQAEVKMYFSGSKKVEIFLLFTALR